VKFEILTDHKALEHLMTQKNLSARQARWLDTLSQLDFRIWYIEGTTNILVDTLSCIYGEEAKGMEQVDSEYVSEAMSNDENELETCTDEEITRPLVAGLVAAVATESGVTSEGVCRNPVCAQAPLNRYDPEIPGREGEVSTGKHLIKCRPRERSGKIDRVCYGY
jgi:hypothetical protein